MTDPLQHLARCRLCPRGCGANRLEGLTGYCGVGCEAVVSHWGPHFGEEPPISGSRGSGNVFFSSCNLRCIFCQNHQISHGRVGKAISVEELASICLALQDMRCHNINLVSPTPYIPLIARAIPLAKEKGVTVPFVYNTNAYETVDALRLLEGLIDIYLPDFKYWSKGVAKRLSDVPLDRGYPEYARRALREMYRQVGPFVTDGEVGCRGVIIRHLVLPGNLAGSVAILGWIGEEFGKDAHISLMAQYTPLFEAGRYAPLGRRLRRDEYERLIRFLIEEGYENVFLQELESAATLVPDFDKEEPFEAAKESMVQAEKAGALAYDRKEELWS